MPIAFEAMKIGYVLSGGGARGFAHLGVIKFLEELGIYPHAISGTSAGAIVGALYASGKGPDDIMNIFRNNSFFGLGNLAWRKEGFFSMEVLRALLKTTFKEDDFAGLKTKLFVVATDLVEGKTVVFSTGNLIDAIIASASVPVVFEPVIMADKILVDGGVLNDFPVEPLSGICDVIIGSFVNKIEKGVGKNSFFKTFNIAERCFHLAIANSAYSKVNNCDVFIEVPLHHYDMYDLKHADEIFKLGYDTALLHKEQLISLQQKSK